MKVKIKLRKAGAPMYELEGKYIDGIQARPVNDWERQQTWWERLWNL